MSEAKQQGGCHCGTVRYEVHTEIETVMVCNCSICSKKGYMLAMVAPEKISVLSGANDQSDYQFYKNNIHHRFCKNCGVTCYGEGTAPDGQTMFAVNVRTLDDVDLNGFTIQNVDGKSF